MDIQQRTFYNILLIGDSCFDVYNYGICERISPEAPVPILKHTKSKKVGGMSLNVYNNLRAFGIQVDHITNLENIEKHRFLEQESGQQLLRVDFGEKEELKEIDLNMINKLNKDYDLIVISDYNKGFLRHDSISKICSIFKGKDIFVDSKKQDLSCFTGCVIKINKMENKMISNKGEDNVFIVTVGADGALYDGQTYSAKKVEVYDVCGAGDVFLSSLVYKYLETKDLKKSIPFANRFASKSVTKKGTYVITQEDIDDLCV